MLSLWFPFKPDPNSLEGPGSASIQRETRALKIIGIVEGMSVDSNVSNPQTCTSNVAPELKRKSKTQGLQDWLCGEHRVHGYIQGPQICSTLNCQACAWAGAKVGAFLA